MTAIHQVRDLLVTKVETLTYDGSPLKALTDRDRDTPAKPGDCPAVMIEENGAELLFLEGHAGGTITHRSQFSLTCLERASDTASSRERAYGVFSVLIEALLSDWSLDGAVQQILPLSYGGEVFAGNDVEGIALDLQIDFCTSLTDFDTLLT